MKKKSMFYIVSILIIGMMFGTILSLFIGSILPEGNVKDFFMLSRSIGWDADSWAEFGFMRIKFGFFIDISVLSVVGVSAAWYILRYFK